MAEVYFTFNGKSSKDFGIEVRAIGRDVLPEFVSNDTEFVPGRPGNYSWGTNVGQYKIPVWIQWNRRGKFSNFRNLTRQIAAWLDTEGKPAPLIFSDEPDKTYYAYLVGGTSIDQLLHMGQATLTFNCPYPYAYGKRVTRDGLEAIYTSFRRDSSAYDSDYNEVAPGLPRYVDGKYGQGIFIEEGTINLLSSASSPTQEEVSVSEGGDYYLTTVGGSATIEHKKHEALNLRLDKEGEAGQDFHHTDTIRDDFLTGSHHNTIVPNGSVTLVRSGTDYDFTWDTKEEWEAPENIRNGTGSFANDNLDMIYLPQWNFIDHFLNYANYWSPVGSGGQLIQGNSYVTIRGSVSSNFGIDIQNDPNIRVRFPATAILKYRNRGPQAARFIIEQGDGEGYIIELDDVSGNWVYLWMTFQNGTATIYKNGQLVGTVASTGASTINQMQLYIPGGRNADFDVDFLYVDWDYNKGAPPSDGWWEGTWETPWIDLSQVGNVEETLLEWKYDFITPNIEDADYQIEYQLRILGTPQGSWTSLNVDPAVTGDLSRSDFMSGDLSKGASAIGVEIKLRVTLRTRDPVSWPFLDYLRLYLKSGYHKTGTYTSPVFDVSIVRTAVDSLLTGVTTTPSGTSVSVEVSVDGGTFTTASFGSPIPGISGTTPSTLQYRIILETTDVSVAPSLDEITIQIIAQGTTYVTEKTFSLPAVDVSNVGIATGSIIEWQADTPTSTSITIETSLDGSTWTPATNGDSFIPAGTDLTGKSVYIRGTLETTDNTVTPTLSYIAWRITQQEPNRIKPATGTLIITPTNVTRWQLEPKTYPTTWTVGTREPETLSAYRFSRFMNDQEGTFLIWVYDDLKDLGRRYVFDTDDHLFSLFREGSTYHLQLGGQDFATSPAVSGWVQFGVRWSGQTFAFFVNGSKVKEDSIGSPIDWETASDLLWIGSDNNDSNQWNQTLDDIYVSERAMTDGEILDAYNSPTSLLPDRDTTYKMEFEGSFTDPTEGVMDVGGTAETFPVFRVVFTGSIPTFKITHVGKGQSVIIHHDFEAGDELIVDAEKSKILINGAVQMTALDLSSDFFSLIPGRNELDFDPDGVAEVSATWTERWK